MHMTCMRNIGCNEILTEQLHRGLHRVMSCVCRRIIMQHPIPKSERGNTAHNVVVMVAVFHGNMPKIRADIKHLGTSLMTKLTH